MNGRILGIDLNDQRTVLTFYSEEFVMTFPTAVCMERDSKSWLIGSDAYESVLSGNGILTDRLYSFVEKDRKTTLYGVEYDAVSLLGEFLRLAVDAACRGNRDLYPEHTVICIPSIDSRTVEKLRSCMENSGIGCRSVNIISRAEAFIYYVMSQSPDLRNNNVALFSLEDNELTYYELKIQRKVKSTLVFADQELLDESFNLDILKSEAGVKLADKILLSCAERLFKNKAFSSVFLTGSGFSDFRWSGEFMKYVCSRRKVFADEELFSLGAGSRGADLAGEKPIFSFIPICDGRTDTAVYLNINRKDRVTAYPIINIGDPWYSVDRTVTVIPYGSDCIELSTVPMDERKRKLIRIPLDFLPERPDRTSMLSLNIHFINAGKMTVELKDLGFGDIYPSSGCSAVREESLWD